jgi:hypothetical protein
MGMRFVLATLALATACSQPGTSLVAIPSSLVPPIPTGLALPRTVAAPVVTAANLTVKATPRVSTSAVNTPPPIANVDPDDDDVLAPPDSLPDCAARLKEAGVKWSQAELRVTHQAAGFDCGTPQAIVYHRGPSGVRWNIEPLVSCRLALGIARFEGILQDESMRVFKSKVRRVEQAGTYSCRKMARFKLVSEHSYANAIDIKAIELENGVRLTVEKHFGDPNEEPKTEASRFLRTIAHRAFDEDAFSVVLTPHFDALHHDHLHLDEARYRVDGSRAR